VRRFTFNDHHGQHRLRRLGKRRIGQWWNGEWWYGKRWFGQWRIREWRVGQWWRVWKREQFGMRRCGIWI
jgi:hypothetical protein